MGKYPSLLFVFFLLAFSTNISDNTWEAIQENGDSAFFDVIENYQGEYVAVGYSTYDSYGGQDMFFCKYSKDGKLKNKNHLGLNKDDVALDVELLPDGQYVISGYRKVKAQSEGVMLKLNSELKTVWVNILKPDISSNSLRKTKILDNKQLVSILGGKVFNYLILTTLEGRILEEIKIPSLKGEDIVIFEISSIGAIFKKSVTRIPLEIKKEVILIPINV